MKNIINYLGQETALILGSLGFDTQFAIITKSNRPDISQFQCNAAFAICKEVKVSPKEIADKIAGELEKKSYISSAKPVMPGFINIVLTDEFLIECLNGLAHDNDENKLGVPAIRDAKRANKTIIDFCGANVAKPMHVGHLRSTIIGDSLARLARHLGDEVITDNHLGDWGTQMGLLIALIKEKKPALPYFKEGLKVFPSLPPVELSELENFYLEASARAKGDEDFLRQAQDAILDLQQGHFGYLALWKHFVNLSVEKMKIDLNRLGVEFDLWRGESFYQPMIPAMIKDLVERGFAEFSQGAVVMFLNDMKGMEESPPLILLKKNGASLYHTTDLVALVSRQKELKVDRVLYVVDARQGLHFKQVLAAAEKMGVLSHFKSVEHIGFGTVNGRDGRPFKTREGGVMKLADLISLVTEKAQERMEEAGVANDYSAEEKKDIAGKVGLATLKFADLMNNRLSDYVFDLEKFSKFEGKTGPYILYTAVRIKSILRKSEESGLTFGAFLSFKTHLERNIVLDLLKIEDIYVSAYRHSNPSFLCEYVFNLCQSINSFYRENHILKEGNKERQGAWLSLMNLSLVVIEKTLNVLGIRVPDRI